MSAEDAWDLVTALVIAGMLVLYFAIQAIRHEETIPSKFINGELNERDEAVIKFRAAHRSPRCNSCKHWTPVWYGGKGPQMTEGVCRRYPPHLARRRLSVRVKGDDWCGEHALAPNE